ncbi:MAG TPA: hypothetical protein VFP94_00465 [Terriglobales bacterium]|nr:hypothetical protein [Terriglobales bacterium]
MGGTIPLIGVTGQSGSGKSTIASALCAALCSDTRWPGSAVMLAVDWYYHDLSQHPPETRSHTDFDRLDAIDWDLLCENLSALRRGQPCLAPRYDFATSSRCDAFVSTQPGQLIVIEGIFLLSADVLRRQLDYTVLVCTDDRIRRNRRLERDIRQRGFTEAGAIRLEQQATQAFDRLNPNPDQLADLVVDGSAPLESITDNLLTAIVSRFGHTLS